MSSVSCGNQTRNVVSTFESFKRFIPDATESTFCLHWVVLIYRFPLQFIFYFLCEVFSFTKSDHKNACSICNALNKFHFDITRSRFVTSLFHHEMESITTEHDGKGSRNPRPLAYKHTKQTADKSLPPAQINVRGQGKSSKTRKFGSLLR